MGKRKYLTQTNFNNKSLAKISKNKKQNNSTLKKSVSFSTSHFKQFKVKRGTRIFNHVKNALKKLINKGIQDNNKRLISALNIASQNQIICSAMDIPSIQNMVMSKNQLSSFNKYDYNYNDQQYKNSSQSGVSFHQGLSFCLLESQPQLMLNYICIVEKAFAKLGIPLSANQNQKLIKGVWNILIKFWSDDFEDNQYQNLNAKIQWGILQLLNFDLKVTRKQRILMEGKINHFHLPQ